MNKFDMMMTAEDFDAMGAGMDFESIVEAMEADFNDADLINREFDKAAAEAALLDAADTFDAPAWF